MQLTLALLLSITLAPTLSQKLTPNAVTSLLQGILSPKNTEQLMHMLSAAANEKRALPNMARNVNRRFAIVDNMPRTESPNKMARIVHGPQEMCMKNSVLVQNSNNAIIQNGNQKVLPKNKVVQSRTEVVLPNNVMIQNGREVTTRNVIVRNNEMPKRVVVQNNEYALGVPQMRAPEVVQKKVFVNPQNMRPAEVQQNVLISQPQVTEYMTIPQQNVLIRNENPFMPAASPVSPLMASSSSALPTAMPQSRGRFLRKIPIPPPTL